MNLNLIRKWFTPISTIGELFVDDIYECFTLEDVCHEGPKVPKKTAIPYGRYEIIVTYSKRFEQMMPLLLDVPGFEGIRIHRGNKAEETDGCILVGKERYENFIGFSKIAYEALFEKIMEGLNKGKVYISIEKGELS